MPIHSSGPKVALLNNLGGVTPLEMAVLAEELARSDVIDDLKYLVGPAPMMTALDRRGFSVSILPVEAQALALLQTPVAMRDWPGCQTLGAPVVVKMPDGLAPVRIAPSSDPKTAALIVQCCDMFIASEAALNALDAQSGDGDTGATLAGASRALQGAIDRLPLADHPRLYHAIGQELSQTMGRSSGVLLAIFFAAAGDAALSGKSHLDALKAGLARVVEVGGAHVGDRTMIDALDLALNALPESFVAASKAARKGADHTAGIVRAMAGRASYISEGRLSGYNDPGAEAVALLFEKLGTLMGP